MVNILSDKFFDSHEKAAFHLELLFRQPNTEIFKNALFPDYASFSTR